MNHFRSRALDRSDDGWFIPAFMLAAVLALFVLLIVLLVRGSSSTVPSSQKVESTVLQLWKDADGSSLNSPFVTCDYDSSQWSIGYSFSCTAWKPGVQLFRLDHLVNRSSATVHIVIQAPPLGETGNFGSVMFSDQSGSTLIQF